MHTFTGSRTDRSPASRPDRSPISRRRSRRAIGVAVTAAVAAASSFGAGVQASAAPAAATDLEVFRVTGWLEAQLEADGSVEGFGGSADAGATLDVALSLGAEGIREDAFDLVVSWLTANVETVIAGSGADSPAAIGALLLVADAAGLDPTAFGGVDLPARLAATLGLHTAGLYGAADPTYDGAYRHALALLGLAAHDIDPPPAAVAWLLDQQCDAATPAAEGGWLPYRSDTSLDCPAPDPIGFTGPDTNQTAMAVQALVAVGEAPGSDPLAFLADAQGADGGFAYLAGGMVDPNSTALVIQALVASGEDPTAAPWATAGGDPVSSLRSWQLLDGDDRGALASPFSGGAADLFASRQAVWGLLERPFPLGAVTFPEPIPLDPPDPTTSTTAPGESTSTTAGGATSATTSSATEATAARPVATAARFTG